MSLWIYLDGKYVSKEEAKVSVFEHGFLYGDGVFEGIRAYGGKVFKLEEHLKRLYNSAKAISLEIPLSREDLKEKVLGTLRKNELKDAYIRLVVSRGEGDLGLDPRKCPHPQVIIITHKIALYSEELYEKGLEVIVSSTRKNIPAALDPRIKSLNYLNNILAKIEANIQGASEAIMLNKDGYIAECTGDNIFIVKEGTLITPPIWIGALEGITRNLILKLATKEGIPIKEEPFTISSLYTSEECFLTGTAAEIAPVTRIDKKTIGKGKAGKITQKLIKNFRQLTQSEGTPIY
ncbi:MAG: branched-chain-amino-acid transaminase [Candidatus Aerophobetes bacterium]|nr:branched-chain-amino-acid transaminase [Candidatus Aerophobetes bacterium]